MNNKGADQTAWMHRLICAFVVGKWHKTHFLMAQLIWMTKVHLNCQIYHKFPKYSDTQNICCNHSKIWTLCLYHRIMSPNDADGMANSVDPDQCSLIWVCTVCPGISVRKLRIITVNRLPCQQQTLRHTNRLQCLGVPHLTSQISSKDKYMVVGT